MIEIKCGSRDQWLITLEDDGAHGYNYTASKMGVLWAKGWVRTRRQRHAEIAAKTAGMGASSDYELHPEETK
jgi:hypothetical protein